ncbi:MAG: hypothetical protein AAGN46_05820 [Acidobacteriota bacterium]
MRSVHVVQYRSGVVALSHSIAEQMNIEENSVLYAQTLPREHSCVVSPVPIDRWPYAHRLVVYTSGGSGRLAAVTRMLSMLGINVLTASAAAISTDAQLCVTAIVEIRDANCDDLVADLQQMLSEVSIDNTPVLLQSGLFSQGGISPVELKPLAVLHSIFQKFGNRPRYELHLDNWTIDLRVSSIAGDGGSLLRGLEPPGSRVPTKYALITPDTEDKYFRLSLVDPHAILRRISFPIKIESPERCFAGYFQAAIETLAAQKFNLFDARDLLVRKTLDQDSVPSEQKNFVFLADVSESPLAGASNPRPEILRHNLVGPFRDTIEGHRLHTDEEARVIIDWSNDLEVGTMRELLPLCFLATNASEQDPVHVRWARRVFATLLHLGFRPVQVDIALSESILSEARDLIDICPILVSLHVPSEKNRLADGTYAPSDWVLFEESCMLEQRRKIFPFRQASVRQPNFRRQIYEFPFEDDEGLHKQCQQLERSIAEHMRTPGWKEVIAETSSLIKERERAWVERTMEMFWPGSEAESASAS